MISKTPHKALLHRWCFVFLLFVLLSLYETLKFLENFYSYSHSSNGWYFGSKQRYRCTFSDISFFLFPSIRYHVTVIKYCSFSCITIKLRFGHQNSFRFIFFFPFMIYIQGKVCFQFDTQKMSICAYKLTYRDITLSGIRINIFFLENLFAVWVYIFVHIL